MSNNAFPPSNPLSQNRLLADDRARAAQLPVGEVSRELEGAVSTVASAAVSTRCIPWCLEAASGTFTFVRAHRERVETLLQGFEEWIAAALGSDDGSGADSVTTTTGATRNRHARLHIIIVLQSSSRVSVAVLR